MAGDETLINWLDVAEIASFGKLTPADFAAPRDQIAFVNRQSIAEREFNIIDLVFEDLMKSLSQHERQLLKKFIEDNKSWIESYANSKTLDARKQEIYKYMQWVFSRQVEKTNITLKNKGGISLGEVNINR